MKIKKGVTRIVIICFGYVFKIPNFTSKHLFFLQGFVANYKERYITITFKYYKHFYSKINPTLFCTYFGLLSIQKYVTPLTRELTSAEKRYFKQQTIDNKKENFGILNGKIVCIDYG